LVGTVEDTPPIFVEDPEVVVHEGRQCLRFTAQAGTLENNYYVALPPQRPTQWIPEPPAPPVNIDGAERQCTRSKPTKLDSVPTGHVRLVADGRPLGVAFRTKLAGKDCMCMTNHQLREITVSMAAGGKVFAVNGHKSLPLEDSPVRIVEKRDVAALEIDPAFWTTLGVRLLPARAPKNAPVFVHYWESGSWYRSVGNVCVDESTHLWVAHTANTPDRGGASGAPLMQGAGAVAIHRGFDPNRKATNHMNQAASLLLFKRETNLGEETPWEEYLAKMEAWEDRKKILEEFADADFFEVRAARLLIKNRRGLLGDEDGDLEEIQAGRRHYTHVPASEREATKRFRMKEDFYDSDEEQEFMMNHPDIYGRETQQGPSEGTQATTPADPDDLPALVESGDDDVPSPTLLQTMYAELKALKKSQKEVPRESPQIVQQEQRLLEALDELKKEMAELRAEKMRVDRARKAQDKAEIREVVQEIMALEQQEAAARKEERRQQHEATLRKQKEAREQRLADQLAALRRQREEADALKTQAGDLLRRELEARATAAEMEKALEQSEAPAAAASATGDEMPADFREGPVKTGLRQPGTAQSSTGGKKEEKPPAPESSTSEKQWSTRSKRAAKRHRRKQRKLLKSSPSSENSAGPKQEAKPSGGPSPSN
jgi:hypothetical protein